MYLFGTNVNSAPTQFKVFATAVCVVLSCCLVFWWMRRGSISKSNKAKASPPPPPSTPSISIDPWKDPQQAKGEKWNTQTDINGVNQHFFCIQKIKKLKMKTIADRRVYCWHRESGTTRDADGGGGHWSLFRCGRRMKSWNSPFSDHSRPIVSVRPLI